MLHTIIMLCALSVQPAAQTTDQAPAPTTVATSPAASPARAFMESLAKTDESINTMTGQVQYTIIQALESDLQKRIGNLYLTTDHESGQRGYAVRFNSLQLDNRLSDIREHYIFDGRWFVERLPDQKQFNKRELVAADEQLDPMELMREAPFWVSLGRNTDRVFKSYNIDLLDHADGLANNPDFPELSFLIETVEDSQQIKLSPKPGSGFEDDWEWVRIWFNSATNLPMLYVKADWSGDLQIVQLFDVKTNTELDPRLFDTTTPPPESGWKSQISPWRGDADTTVNSQTIQYEVIEQTP
jgi:hypothetical protein